MYFLNIYFTYGWDISVYIFTPIMAVFSPNGGKENGAIFH